MKTLIFLLCLLVAGCAIPVVALQSSETDRFAIIEIDLEAWLGDNSRGEFAYVSHIDGVWEERYAQKRAGRVRPEGPMIKYLFLEPGNRELTLVYNRNEFGIGGRKLWSGGVTEKAELKRGRYFVRYSREENFVTLWLEDSSGTAVTPKRRSVIGEVVPAKREIIPILIPVS
jgi:hypothetical protein